jgi:hypothetical protein
LRAEQPGERIFLIQSRFAFHGYNMKLEYDALDQLTRSHPAWRLLRSDHAPLVIGFLDRTFVSPNVRMAPQSYLIEMLEDFLFQLREREGANAFPKAPLEYLNDWASDDKRWLRKVYVADSDEPHFDLMPSTEKAILWVSTLTGRPFVGTESRLLTLIELLKQVSEGSEADPEARIAKLVERRNEIDREIERNRAGSAPPLDATAIKDRFQQFVQLARELLTDFREVEQNFRGLDRSVRERIALWDGSKGALLEEIMGERDVIAESDQGRSFRAFWDFLMSQARQEEFGQLLKVILQLPPVSEMNPDPRLRRVHHDWMEAGEQTQRTVSQLSQQLRRFLDDQAWLENRRIMDIIHNVETRALAIRGSAPMGDFMEIANTSVSINLPFERPLFKPAPAGRLTDVVLDYGDAEVDISLLFSRVVVDRAALEEHIKDSLRTRSQITLSELVSARPLHQGLAELLTYLQVASEWKDTLVEEDIIDVVEWNGADGAMRTARLPRIILVRNGA